MVNTFLQLIILLHAMRLNNLVGGGENFFKSFKIFTSKVPLFIKPPLFISQDSFPKGKMPGHRRKTPTLPFRTDIEHANEGVQWSLPSGDIPGTKTSVP